MPSGAYMTASGLRKLKREIAKKELEKRKIEAKLIKKKKYKPKFFNYYKVN